MHVEKALPFLYLYIEAGRRVLLLKKEKGEGRIACSNFKVLSSGFLAKKLVMITDGVITTASGTMLSKLF